uniref:OmpA family protein n=1 Tax=Alistipes sp. TaxID=1872444 RepID=UPI0040573EE1
MKKTLFIMLALGATTVVMAQSNQAPANAVLVSQTRSGDVVTTRYKIPHNNGKHAEFDVHYAINRSQIAPNYSDNTEQIAELKDFMEQTKDTTMHISTIHIVGYASPDGNAKQNDTLASQRAQSLYHYAVNTYHPEQKITTDHKAFKWSDCVDAVEKSDIPHKEQVLSILKSTSHTEPQKEQALRKMPDAWRYLATHILPQMRYADIEFDYGVDEFVTRTTVVPKTEPAKPVQTTQPQQPEEVVVSEEMGIIVATPRHDVDSKENKRNQKKARKADKKNVKGGYEAIYW